MFWSRGNYVILMIYLYNIKIYYYSSLFEWKDEYDMCGWVKKDDSF